MYEVAIMPWNGELIDVLILCKLGPDHLLVNAREFTLRIVPRSAVAVHIYSVHLDKGI